MNDTDEIIKKLDDISSGVKLIGSFVLTLLVLICIETCNIRDKLSKSTTLNNSIITVEAKK